MGIIGPTFSVTGLITLQSDAAGFPKVHCCALILGAI